MMKADELAILDRAIKALGPQSYLGPWLTEHRVSIAADIANDVCIDVPMPSEARREAQRLIDEANRRRAEILTTAQNDATTIRNAAYAERDQLRARAAARLSTLADEVRRDWQL